MSRGRSRMQIAAIGALINWLSASLIRTIKCLKLLKSSDVPPFFRDCQVSIRGKTFA